MRATVLLVLTTVLLGACSDEGRPIDHRPTPQGTLKIGLIPARDIFTELRRYQPLADYLSENLGVKIELKILRRYGNIVNNFNAEHLDGAFFGSFTYVLAHARLGVEVLARPESEDGTSTYCGLLIVSKQGGIRRVEDMKGKVFAFVDRATTAGYLFPLAVFRKYGVHDDPAFFRETYFTGTHSDVIADVLAQKADVGALKNTVYEEFVRSNPEAAERLVVLMRSADVPENGLAVRKDLDPKVASAMKSALLKMHLDPEGLIALKAIGALRFIETTKRDYDSVIEMAREAAVDLKNYIYVNN